jgi:hypothetical protein
MKRSSGVSKMIISGAWESAAPKQPGNLLLLTWGNSGGENNGRDVTSGLTMEFEMSKLQDPRQQGAKAPNAPREQLERLYRAIGISAVAAAAAQIARPETKAEPAVRDVPFCLRDDSLAA